MPVMLLCSLAVSLPLIIGDRATVANCRSFLDPKACSSIWMGMSEFWDCKCSSSRTLDMIFDGWIACGFVGYAICSLWYGLFFLVLLVCLREPTGEP